MEKKKILHIAQSPGGVAEYIYILLNNINNEKYENFLVCSNEYKHIEKINELDLKKYYLDMKREINIKKDIEAIRRIKNIIKEINPDIIYLHSSKAGGLGRLAISKHKVKIIYNSHGWYFNAKISGIKKMIYALLEKILAFNTDKIINISESEFEAAKKYRISNENKMVVINNAIDFDRFSINKTERENIRKKYNISNTDIVIGIVGRLAEQKDPLTTIKTFEKLCEKYDNLYCMFIGDGELKNTIINYCKEKKIENKVIITGWIENVEKYITAIDIGMLPSKWEGFGLVILEYIAAKKPIVASDIGGISNILNNSSFSELIKPEDVNGFVNAIDKIIYNYKKYKNDLNNEYENYKKTYSINKFENDHEKIFDQI